MSAITLSSLVDIVKDSRDFVRGLPACRARTGALPTHTFSAANTYEKIAEIDTHDFASRKIKSLFISLTIYFTNTSTASGTANVKIVFYRYDGTSRSVEFTDYTVDANTTVHYTFDAYDWKVIKVEIYVSVSSTAIKVSDAIGASGGVYRLYNVKYIIGKYSVGANSSLDITGVYTLSGAVFNVIVKVLEGNENVNVHVSAGSNLDWSTSFKAITGATIVVKGISEIDVSISNSITATQSVGLEVIIFITED